MTIFLILIFSSCKIGQKEPKPILSLHLELNKREFKFKDVPSILYRVKLTNITKPQKNIIVEVSKRHPRLGYQSDDFIENDMYFLISFSKNGKSFSPYKEIAKVSAFYVEDPTLEENVRLKSKEYIIYDFYHLNNFYHLFHAGFYRIQAVTSKKYGSIKSNIVELRIS